VGPTLVAMATTSGLGAEIQSPNGLFYFVLCYIRFAMVMYKVENVRKLPDQRKQVRMTADPERVCASCNNWLLQLLQAFTLYQSPHMLFYL